MSWFLYTLGALVLINLILHWCGPHGVLVTKYTHFGRFDFDFGISECDCRDFDLMLSCDPRWYLTFRLALWSPYIGIVWNRDEEEHPDCSCDGVCFTCGCPNGCGEIAAARQEAIDKLGVPHSEVSDPRHGFCISRVLWEEAKKDDNIARHIIHTIARKLDMPEIEAGVYNLSCENCGAIGREHVKEGDQVAMFECPVCGGKVKAEKC